MNRKPVLLLFLGIAAMAFLSSCEDSGAGSSPAPTVTPVIDYDYTAWTFDNTLEEMNGNSMYPLTAEQVLSSYSFSYGSSTNPTYANAMFIRLKTAEGVDSPFGDDSTWAISLWSTTGYSNDSIFPMFTWYDASGTSLFSFEEGWFSQLLYNGGTGTTVFLNDNTSDNRTIMMNWHNTVITSDGTNLYCYLNGELKNTISTTFDLSGSGRFVFGELSGSSFMGKIDNAVIYEDYKDATEVAAIYAAGR